MQDPLYIPTHREGVVLRQLATEADDIAYYDAIDTNREHLSQFDDTTASKYLDLEMVRRARLSPENPDKLRLGIWDKELFVGSANLTPLEDEAELGYWLDARYTGRGYATAAARALGAYALRDRSRVVARVAEENNASVKVLTRAGFRLAAEQAGHLLFELTQVRSPHVLKGGARSELERFAELPNRREALRAKDQNNVTVFIARAVSKKLYRCGCCQEDIHVGREHVVMSRIQMSRKFGHHHIDFNCLQGRILPTLKKIEIIGAEEASTTAVNAKRRRYRNTQRRIAKRRGE